MSGLEVLGAISAVVGVIDACVKIYESASKDLKLSDTFRVVLRQLPILADTLKTCKTYLESPKVSIPPEVCSTLEDILGSCKERARTLRTIFEEVITTETDGWNKRYVKLVRKLGKGNKVEELMALITKDVQLVVNHRVVQSAEPEQRQKLDQILQDLQKLEPSIEDDTGAGTNITNWYGKQNVNTGDGHQYINDNMSGTQIFNYVTRQKSNFTFTKPVGLRIGLAPDIDTTLFIGRATEIRRIHQVLILEKNSTGQRRLVLGGMGGVGKTQLAIAYAKQMCNSYDSIFWTDAISEATLKSSFKSIAESIFDLQDLQRLSGDDIVVSVKQWLSDTKNTKWLLIFDNYDEPQSYDLKDYYPQASQGSIITTTRVPDEISPDPLMLHPLSNIEEGLEILRTRSKRENVKEDVHAQRLVKRLEGLPLALATAGAFLHKDRSTETFEWYLHEYVKRWNINPRRPPRLSEYQNRTLYTTWDLSYRRLEEKEDPAAAQMLKLLAYFGNQSTWHELFEAGRHDELPQWLRVVCDDSVEFRNVMSILVDYCFAEVQSGTSAYNMHRCVHDWTLYGLNKHIESWSYWYAFNCVAESIRVEDTTELMCLAYGRFVPHAIRLCHDKFVDTISDMREAQFHKAENVTDLLSMQDELNTAEFMLCEMLICKKKILGLKHTKTVDTSFKLGIVYYKQDKLDQAESMFKRVVSDTEKLLGHDHISTLYMNDNLGAVYRAQNKLDQAEEVLTRVLTRAEKALGPKNTSITVRVNNLGLLYHDQGKLDKAQMMLERALAAKEEYFGFHHISTIETTSNLGLVYRDQRKLDKAETMLKRALIGREHLLGPEHITTLQTVYHLSHLYYTQGRLDNTEQIQSRVLSLCQESNTDIIRRHAVGSLAVVLSEHVRLAQDKQGTLSRLASLIQYVDKWNDKETASAMCYYLTKALIGVKDDANAQIAILLRIKFQVHKRFDLLRLGCDGCQCKITSTTGQHMCRLCQEIDLCNTCMSAYTNKSIPLSGCDGHEFFDAGSPASEILKSPECMNEMALHKWLEKLKKQYCTDGKMISDGEDVYG